MSFYMRRGVAINDSIFNRIGFFWRISFISKSKRYFSMKSSTYYFHIKTKVLTDFQICIRVPLNIWQLRILKILKYCLLFSVYFIFHSGSNAGREKVSFSSFHFSKIDTCAWIERLGHSYWFWVMSNEVILSNENIKLNHSFPMHRFPNPENIRKPYGVEKVSIREYMD